MSILCPANFRVNILCTVDIKTQKIKCTVCPLQTRTRKELKTWHVLWFRVEPCRCRCDGKAFHPCSIFFTGFQAHFSELRAALEFSSGGIVLCQQQSPLGSMSWRKRCKHHRTKSCNTHSVWLILRVNFTLGLFVRRAAQFLLSFNLFWFTPIFVFWLLRVDKP